MASLTGNQLKLANFIVNVGGMLQAAKIIPDINIPSLGDLLDELEQASADLLQDPKNINALDVIINTGNLEALSDLVRNSIDGIMNTPRARETAEVFGSVVMGPFLSLMEEYSNETYGNPEDFAAAFHGLNIMLTIPQFLANLFQGSAVGTVLGRIGGGFTSIYWNLGLGFLGWQTLAPFLSAGLQPRLTRHYNAKFLPNRFDMNTLLYLYSIGDMTAAELLQAGKEAGWRPVDVQVLLKSSYKRLNDSEIRSLHKAGLMTLDDIRDELLKQGYNPRFVGQIQKDLLLNDSGDEKGITLTNARKAYKLGLQTEIEFRNTLKLIGYSDAAINLELSIIQAQQRDDNRELTLNQIREGYVLGTVTTPEVQIYLTNQTYTQDDINRLLATWDAAKKPKILRLNQGTIKQALLTGVINASKAFDLLVSVGYENASAQLIVDTALATLNLTKPHIPISLLIQALSHDVISQSEFTAQLQARDIPDSDIQIYIGLANRTQVTGLNVNELRQAFIYNVLDEQQTLQALQEIDTNTANNQIRVDTWKEQQASLRLKPTAGMYITFYRQGLFDANTLVRYLTNLGFTQQDAALMVQSADSAFPRQANSGEVKTMFTAGVITSDRAVTILTDGGLDRAQSQDLVKAWGLEIAYNAPSASVDKLLEALRNGIITESDFTVAMKDKGYGDDTIAFYLRLALAPPVEATKELTKADIQGLYADALIPYQDALERLINQGYSADDSELLLERKKPSIEKSQVIALFMAGFIDPSLLQDALLSAGYSQQDISDYLDSIGY